jgi:hypothetical protein
MKGAIYLLETAAKNSGNNTDETCIVVGGVYGSDANTTYYRLDFLDKDGKTHLDILRNHQYLCNITDVKCSGYSTVDEAFKSSAYNLVADINSWDEGQIRNIAFNSQYMLGVSHDLFELNAGAHNANRTDNILKIFTDYPTGWTATVWANTAGTTPVSWLSINITAGAGGAQINETHLITDANTGAERTAYIHVKAGKLTCIVKVVQNEYVIQAITVTPDNIVLPYTAQNPSSQKVTVTCLKNGNPDPSATWTLTSNSAWLTLSLNSNGSGASSTVNGTGSQTVYLVAPANTGATSRSANLLMDGNVKVTVSQNYFVTIGESGSSAPHIYMDGFGSDAKLLLTQNPRTVGMLFQFGRLAGWIFSNTTGDADYRPLPNAPVNWQSDWHYNSTTNIAVAHSTTTFADNGKGDPCRLVGYTVQEIQNAYNETPRRALDNGIWRLPTEQENLAYVKNGRWTDNYDFTSLSGWITGTEFLPAHGFRNAIGTNVEKSSKSAKYWANATTNGGRSASMLFVNGTPPGTLGDFGDVQSTGCFIRCVRQ